MVWGGRRLILMEDPDRYPCRRIYLKQGNDPALQARAACEALTHVDGIELAAPHDSNCVHVIYCLDQISFEIIVELLIELDFELEDSFLMSFRNTIYCYLDNDEQDCRQPGPAAEKSEQGETDIERPEPDKEQYWDDYH